ncbi:MAG TPA: hypothetical protein VNT20_00630 [Flavisolibacter sp.]|nr:hypothetical protein [Flavisolibacter sp.]
MKKVWISLLVSLFSLSAFSQNLSIKSLIGKWETSDGAGLEIIDSSRIFVTYGNDRKPILSYKADFSKSPCWFDFVVKDTAQKLSTMKSLLLLQSNDVLKWQVFDDDDRPADFTADRGDIIILRRKK